MEMKYIVYVTVNLCNGKLYFGVHHTNPEVFDGYIGNGIYRQKQSIRDNCPFHKAVRKYGYKNFVRTTIAVFPDTEEGKIAAYKLEEQIVNPTLLKSKNVYNIVRGGIGGGYDTQKRRVYQFSLDGNYIRSYSSAGEAAIAISTDNIESVKFSIKNCCLGYIYSSQGYYWSYFKEFINKEDFDCNIKRRRKKIAQYTLSGKFLRYFNNIQEARIETGLYNIYYAIRNKASVGNFQWRWYIDDNDIEPFESTVTKYRNKPIIMITPDNKEIEYSSIKQCVELNPELKAKGIEDVLHGVNKTHKTFRFRWK